MRAKFKNNIIATLDIGSSKIVCLIAEVEEDRSLKILGIGHNSAQGFKGTVITDIKLAEASIISAVYEAERMAGLSLEKISLSISGSSIGEEDLEMDITIDEQVTKKNLKDLLDRTINSFNSNNREILHFFPLDFGLDGTYGIKDPVLMYGYSLKAKAKVIYLPTNHVANLVTCLEKCRLNVSNIMISGYSSSFSCLSDEEKDQGVTLIDIGANTTSIAVFYQGSIIACANIPIGGNHITSDVSYGLAVDFITAERIKIMKGNAFFTSFDSGNIIEFDVSDVEDKKGYISASELSIIIRARLEEILEMVKSKMEALATGGLSSKKIVLTGGGSNLGGIKEVAANIFGSAVKIATTKNIDGMGTFNARADFSAAVGTLYFMSINYDKSLKDKKRSFKLHNNSYLNKVFKWFKENL